MLILILIETHSSCSNLYLKNKEGDFKLYNWLSNQRSNKDKLTPERIKRLDALGFVWKVR